VYPIGRLQAYMQQHVQLQHVINQNKLGLADLEGIYKFPLINLYVSIDTRGSHFNTACRNTYNWDQTLFTVNQVIKMLTKVAIKHFMANF